MRELLTVASGTDPKKVAYALNVELEKYGARFPLYDVETLAILFKKATGSEMHESVKTKLKAYHALLTSPEVYEHWHVFEKVVTALIDGFVDVEHVQPPTDVELVLSAYVMTRDTKPNPSKEVKDYIKTVWKKHLGYSVFHPILTQLTKERLSSLEKEVLNKLREYASDPNTISTPRDEVEGQAQRLYRLSIILNDFRYNGEVPLEIINPSNPVVERA